MLMLMRILPHTSTHARVLKDPGGDGQPAIHLHAP